MLTADAPHHLWLQLSLCAAALALGGMVTLACGGLGEC